MSKISAPKVIKKASKFDPSKFISKQAKVHQELEDLVEPHVSSFNFCIDEGLKLAVADLDKVEYEEDNFRAAWWFENVAITKPEDATSSCREAGSSYVAPLYATLCYQEEGKTLEKINKRLGSVPIMVKMTPDQLVSHREEANEVGGYFIVNGNEKVVRLLIMMKKNDIGPNYTPHATMIRCGRKDGTTHSVTVHYLSNGQVNVRFILGKSEFFLPAVLMLKAICDTTDREIYEKIVSGSCTAATSSSDVASYLLDASEVLLQTMQSHPDYTQIYSQQQALAFIGNRFRVVMKQATSRMTDVQVGQLLISKFIFVHLSNAQDKFNLLIFMMQKLFALVNGQVGVDGTDSPVTQEVLTSGNIYLIVIKEKLQEFLYGIRNVLTKERNATSSLNVRFRKAIDRAPDIGQKLRHFLSTGNVSAENSTLDLQQTSGFTIIAERLNILRYYSHFRSIHRGAFFATMKTTAIRKLLPDSWGFFCPVHTPDGSPCGLLNHLTRNCRVVCDLQDYYLAQDSVPSFLASIGVLVSVHQNVDIATVTYLPVLLDGKVIGKIKQENVKFSVDLLRYSKVHALNNIPKSLEIAVVYPAVYFYRRVGHEKADEAFEHGMVKGERYPGVYLFSAPGRMVRPVYYFDRPIRSSLTQPPLEPKTFDSRATEYASYEKKVEFVGSFEQAYMHIACLPEDVSLYAELDYTHIEIEPTAIFSVVADLIPFPDFNQSPRNMYQCQMAKQTMGFPYHAYIHRTDNKIYRIQYPQAPLVQTKMQNEYKVNDYPTGTNAVVAVISYTGYDMEDAMIINKSAYERGFAHASMYKTEKIDLSDSQGAELSNLVQGVSTALKTKKQSENKEELDSEDGRLYSAKLTSDGLPAPGQKLEKGDPFYCVYNSITGEHKVTPYKSQEPCVVDQVRVISEDNSKSLTSASIKLRYNRNPVIGDKFSSRHGQKGVLSQLWPHVDMPFTESGISPDVIINPNAFPSRMTIGMLVESLAGKSAALHAMYQEATPFRFGEVTPPDNSGNPKDTAHTFKDQTASQYFGQELTKAGFNYYGTEVMYSGVLGTMLEAEIYIGVVFYQRLRHMVKDKYQVRATGPVNSLTRQPVKGRKNRGGIRFGEMERDSLLAHGVSFLLHDRLMNCSDASKGFICCHCGSILSPANKFVAPNRRGVTRDGPVECHVCGTGDGIEVIHIPYVFRYLTNELAAVGIRSILFTKGV